MLSSSPAFLKCYECKKSPKQFTFLLCNHIICEKCISKKIQLGNKYNSVLCSCGKLTYFNEESEIVDEEEMLQQSRENGKGLFRNRGGFTSNERRSMIDQRNSFSNNISKQTIDHYSKTLINQRSTMPMLQASQVFSLQKNDSTEQNKRYQPSSPQKQQYINGSLLTSELRNKLAGTEQTKYDESLLLGDYQCFEQGNKRQREPTRAINQFSTLQIGQDVLNKKGDEKKGSYSETLLKQVKNIKDSVIVPINNSNSKGSSGKTQVKQSNLANNYEKFDSKGSNPSGTSHHYQFQSQLGFLKIMFQKDVQQIEYQFKKVIDKITKTYQLLQSDLRSLYIEQVITKEALLSLNLSQMIRKKYEKTIGQNFRALKDHLLLFFHTDNKHNQKNLLFNKTKKQAIESPLLEAYKLNSKFESRLNNSNNGSSSNSENNEQDMRDQRWQIATKNKNRGVRQFQSIQQKVERLTTKHPRQQGVDRTDHVKLYNEESSKRIQTQNIHTSIKRHQSHSNLNQKKQRSHKSKNFHNTSDHCQTQEHSRQQHQRLTQKPIHMAYQMRNTPKSQQQQRDRRIIYYSPPIPYCYKHLQKKQKQAKNYISYIEKLCHEKKMKNNQELFKKVKCGSGYQFGRLCNRK